MIAEVYRGVNTKMAKLCEKYAPQTGMTLLDIDGHRELFARASYSEIELFAERRGGMDLCDLEKTQHVSDIDLSPDNPCDGPWASPHSFQRGAEEFVCHLRRVSMDHIAIYSFAVYTKSGHTPAASICT